MSLLPPEISRSSPVDSRGLVNESDLLDELFCPLDGATGAP